MLPDGYAFKGFQTIAPGLRAATCGGEGRRAYDVGPMRL